MRVAVHQPNYAPWCGYFAKMSVCDLFIFQDDVQFSRGGYVNRVQIHTASGPQWLTLPIPKGSTGRVINELAFADDQWNIRHLRELKAAYQRTPFFDEVMRLIEPVYRIPEPAPARFNMQLIRTLAEYLGLACGFRVAGELGAAGKADERLADLMRKSGGTVYVSGAGGQNYQQERTFSEAGFQLEVRVYKPISYDQGRPDFVAGLSMLDALFYLGRGARNVLVYT